MDVRERISADRTAALKAQDALRLSVLRMLEASLHNREIEKRSQGKDPILTPEEVGAVLRAEAKKRRDAIHEFQKGGRTDLVEKEAAELSILEGYLPPELPEEELEPLVRSVAARLGVSSPKDFGRLMGGVMKELNGRAAGERVSAVVSKVLSA